MTISDPQEQTKWNRTLLILCALFTVAGLGNNILRASSPESAVSFPSEYLLLAGIVTLGVWFLSIAFVVAFGLVRGPATFETWGFVINRRLWISAALVLVTGIVPLALSDGGLLDPFALLKAPAAGVEELFFRGILISTLLSIVQPRGRFGVAGIVCVAAAIWTIIHIPTKNAAELFGIFTGGIFLGYVYYYTRSLLMPIAVHATANAGMIGGVLAIVEYFIIAGLVWVWSRSKKTVQVPAT
jgi:membrane protease YdiL (CAAX protease family)